MSFFEKVKFFLITTLGSPASSYRFEKLAPVEEVDELKIQVKTFAEEKKVAYEEWSKPENIAKRKDELAANAEIALQKGKAMAELAKAQILEYPKLSFTANERLSSIGIKIID